MPRTTDSAKQQAVERVWLTVRRRPNGITEGEIAGFSGIQRRTVNNYLNELCDEGKIDKEGTLWFPLNYEETRLRAFDLSPEEAYTLYLASRLLVKQHDKRNEPAESALHKLAEILTADAGVGQEIAQAASELANRPTRPGYQSVFTAMVRGYIYRKRVAIRYRPLNGRSFETTFETYLMEPSAIGYATYAIGRSSLPDALRAYKIERIEDAQLTRQSYRIPPDFPGLDILRNSWSIIMGDETVDVELRFSPRVRNRVLETQWHPSQVIEDDPAKPNHLLWRVRVADTTDMLPWIRGWGADVEVLAPIELREQLMDEAQRTSRLYGISANETPQPHMLLWAKTDRSANRVHPLLWHLIDVGQVARSLWDRVLADGFRQHIARLLNLDVESAGRLLSFWCATHDIGKACPNFQRKYEPATRTQEQAGFCFPRLFGRNKIKHAAVSAVILPDLLVQEAQHEADVAKQIAKALGGHHGVWPPARLLNSYKNERITGDKVWQEAQRTLIQQLIDEFQPPAAHFLGHDLEEQNTVLTLLSGLASVADWIGSMDRYFPFRSPDTPPETYAVQSARKAERALDALGWTGTQPPHQPASFHELHGFTPRPTQQAVLDQLPCLQKQSLAIIEAPTGIGKTEIALFLADFWAYHLQQRGFYIAMPTMATSNQMYGRTGRFLSARYPSQTINYHLVHSQARWRDDTDSPDLHTEDEDSQGDLEAQTWFLPRKRTLLAPFGVGTVDQTLLSILQTRHFFVRLFALSNKTVIFDEVHAYDVYMSALFQRLLTWLRNVGATVVILSATLPAAERRTIVEAWNDSTAAPEPLADAPYPGITIATGESVTAHALPPGPDRVVSLAWIEREPDVLADELRHRLHAGGCAAIICNTVGRAQEIYQRLQTAHIVPDDALHLFHARMPMTRRYEIEEVVLDRFGPEPTDRPYKAIVVATQVIEQSLDLDFDLMISDLAPADLILQRAGRLHRHARDERPTDLQQPTLLIAKPDMSGGNPDFGSDGYVYEPYLLLRSYLALRAQGELLTLPADTVPLIEAVYGDEDLLDSGLLATVADALESMRQAMVENRRKYEFEARQRLIHPPSAEALMSMPYQELEEDSPDVHPALQAQTRLIGPSITLVCLHRVDDSLYLNPDAHGSNIDLGAKPNGDDTRQLAEASVSLQHRVIVRHFAEQSPPAGWEKHTLLRHYRPAIFVQGVCSIDDSNIDLILDPDLGIEIRKTNR